MPTAFPTRASYPNLSNPPSGCTGPRRVKTTPNRSTQSRERQRAAGLPDGRGSDRHRNSERTGARASGLPAGILLLLLPILASAGWAQESERKGRTFDPELTLVRVNFTTEIRGGGDPAAVIKGRSLTDYRPTIIQVFPSTGVVIDDKGHILTFLGYRWVDMQGPRPSVEIIAPKGEKHDGELIGIDQNIGVAVVKSHGGKLQRTPVCGNCEIKDGITVVTPVIEDAGIAQLQQARIVSMPMDRDAAATGVWTIKINRPLPGAGEPLLDVKHRVLGFVSSQMISPEDSPELNTIMYLPMTQLLASAEKILKVGGDIRTGWLGVIIEGDRGAASGGLAIEDVLEGSPAQKAGVIPGDVIAGYNGKEIREARQFIRLVQDTPIGSKVPLDVLRDGKPLVLQALIEGRRAPENPARIVLNLTDMLRLAENPGYTVVDTSPGAGFWGGLQTVQLTPQLADALQVPGQTGLLVLNVEPQTSFGMAGVQVGDVIVSVDGQRLQSPQSFFSYLRARSRGAHSMILHLLRKGAERKTTIQFSPPGKSEK